MKISRTARFKEAYQKLNKVEKELACKTLKNLAADLHYPALRVKKMHGVEHIWEARVSRSIRVTFQISGDIVVLRNIGRYDDTLERP